MHDTFNNLLIACPNDGGLFLLHQGTTYKLDGLDTTGFVIRGRQMLRGLQPARLVRYADGEECGVTSGEDFGDIHDVLLEEQFHYVVKTDDNEIVKLDERGQERQRWTLPGERDSWHVNCLTRWGSRLVFSAFGDLRLHKEYKQRSRESGFVQDFDTGEKLITGLSQPHSLLAAGDKLLLANSENFEIREYDDSGHLLRSKKFDGYTRGMLLHGNVLYVGLSRSRNVELGPIAHAVVVALDAGTWEELARHALPANEIFSIQHVDPVDLPAILARLASHASRFLGEQVAALEAGGAHLRRSVEVGERRAEELRLELAARDALICDKDRQLDSRDEAIRENERKIYGLLETVHGKDLHLQSREDVIQARDIEIQRRDEEVRNRDAEVRARDEAIRRLESLLVELRLDSSNTIQRNESRIATLMEEARLQAEVVQRLREEVDAQAQRISEMGREADAAYSRMLTLKNELQWSQARVADMESSRSWKLTWPARAIKLAFDARSARKSAKGERTSVARKDAEVSGRRWKLKRVPEAMDPGAHSDAAKISVPVSARRPVFDLRGSDSPIVILTTAHCTYVAEEIAAALRRVEIPSRIIYKMPEAGYDDVPHFVVCPQMFEQLPGLYVSFQMEQSVSSRWFTEEYVRRLENSFAIFDYSLANIAKLQNMGLYAQQMYHVPIGYLDQYRSDSTAASTDYDVIFYGDIQNARRREFIAELSRVCKVKVINDLFGDALHDELARAKLVVNIHYYAGALLETTRLWECLSLGKLVVSERSVDMDQHGELADVVDFVDVDDCAGMVERVRFWLSNEELRQQRLQRNEEILRGLPNQFDAQFYRFLLATDNITFDEFWNVAGRHMNLPGDRICLSLPEFVRRSQSFDRDNRFGFVRFTGLRHCQGWLGCAMSYKLMIMLARQQGLPSLAICEDDVEFPQGFDSRWAAIQEHLRSAPDDWDVFSGLMADVHADLEILGAYERNGMQFVMTDRLISMVFNVYNASTYDAIASWDEGNRDAATNTIDRYLERSRSIRIVTTLPFLVGHKEELHSTLWGFQNTQYASLIAASTTLLRDKLEGYGEGRPGGAGNA